MENTNRRRGLLVRKLVAFLCVTAFLIVPISFAVASAAITGRLDFVNDITSNDSGDGWDWDADAKTLTLNGLDLSYVDTALSTMAVLLPGGSTVVLIGNNRIVNESGIYDTGNEAGGCGIYAEGNLTIQGAGALAIDAGGDGIRVDGKLIISNTTLEIDAGKDALFVKGDVTISGGTILNKSTMGVGIFSEGGGITISGATLTNKTFQGIWAYSDIKISGGAFTAEGGTGIFGINNVAISDCTVNITSLVFGIVGREGNVTVSGCIVNIEAGKYGIFGGDAVTISGGRGTVKVLETGDHHYWAVISGKAIGLSGGITVKGWDGAEYTVPTVTAKCDNDEFDDAFTFVSKENLGTGLRNIWFGRPSTPETGDAGNIMRWMLICIMSLAILGWWTVKGYSGKRTDS